MSRMNKADFMALAAERNIEIEDEPGDRRHIHGYAPGGMKFAATDTHNIGLWDDERGEQGARVDWADMATELELVECTDPNCEYCTEEGSDR